VLDGSVVKDAWVVYENSCSSKENLQENDRLRVEIDKSFKDLAPLIS
jgi:hypothetical protein